LSQIPSERVPISSLVRTPYINVLTYPRISLRAARSRLAQLNKLGVERLIFEGKSKIGGLGILGIGTVSVVVKSEVAGNVFALKIRRTDANRPGMKEEFELTRLANRIGIGAEVLNHTKDLLVLQYLDYVELHAWFKSLRGPERRAMARGILHRVLNQCRKLDIMGLDHGQLSNLRKHIVVVNDLPYVIDFESASLNRTPKNVTTAAQYILIGGRMSALARRLIGLRGHEQVMAALREYKETKSDVSYAHLLEVLRLNSN